MKRSLYAIGIIIFLFACKSNEVVKGERNEVEACNTPNFAFQGGEKLTYKLYYNVSAVWIVAGEVIFEVEDIGSQFHITARGKTYENYDKFFKVNDVYETYLDKKTMLPLTSVREVHEGNYNLYDKIIFNQKEHTAISFRGNTKDDASKSEYSVETCMHDIISIIYFSRNIDFKNLTKGSYFPISIFMDKEAHPLQVMYKGSETKTNVKGLGKFDTQLFSPQTISGKTFKENTSINVWVTDDNNRVPLVIESPLSVGHVKALLINYTGLKNEMSAKVK
jgi:hypothetical protein